MTYSEHINIQVPNIQKWVHDSANGLASNYGIFLSQSEIEHVSSYIKLLIQELDKNPSYDEFIEALAKKDLYEALKLADTTNIRAIYIYAQWIYNYSPM